MQLWSFPDCPRVMAVVFGKNHTINQSCNYRAVALTSEVVYARNAGPHQPEAAIRATAYPGMGKINK